ncbi:uroporphyrinogen-III C-methyltransferase [Labilibaculum antarcticum]|uniref:uroporphyrinogen-III C-methyltransferase n=1 Tax=Labilibaculum antarcticum TaxID=1717717 RepID=A0A1Y1CFT9_9BACT|nr:uroporphyrinogen-III C-methyltransferase [Labilibaculum antarcticum]BAX79184.1 uroporphyrinogen-III C-methyltransferase [Labilibaculum antarcticum]
MKNGKIWIVGAGPGAADLLTIKALRSIQNADVILYDALITDEVRALFPNKAILIDVGKRSGDGKNPVTRQEYIHDQMLMYYLLGSEVVRLKSGDPMVYGRGVEEIRFLLETGLEFELIPGISAAMAASNEFWIPLTERGKSSGIHFHSAVKVGGKKSALNEIIREIENDDTVVIYMGLEHLKGMADELHRRLSKETNINVISKVSYKDSDVISGNTKFFSKIKNHELPASPAVIVLGNHTQIPRKSESSEKGKVAISTRIKSFARQAFLNLF